MPAGSREKSRRASAASSLLTLRGSSRSAQSQSPPTLGGGLLAAWTVTEIARLRDWQLAAASLGCFRGVGETSTSPFMSGGEAEAATSTPQATPLGEVITRWVVVSPRQHGRH